jgi:heat shock protein HslJ
MTFQSKFVKVLMISFLLMLMLAACSRAGSGNGVEPGLEGTSWILEEFGPVGELTAVLPNTEPTLNFEDGQINGHASCNSYFGEVTFGDDGTMTVGMLGSTLMACMDEAMMQQEADFMAALGQVTSYTLSGSQLTLHTPDGVLNFEASE